MTLWQVQPAPGLSLLHVVLVPGGGSRKPRGGQGQLGGEAFGLGGRCGEQVRVGHAYPQQGYRNRGQSQSHRESPRGRVRPDDDQERERKQRTPWPGLSPSDMCQPSDSPWESGHSTTLPEAGGEWQSQGLNPGPSVRGPSKEDMGGDQWGCGTVDRPSWELGIEGWAWLLPGTPESAA